jgi:hypothetical protein
MHEKPSTAGQRRYEEYWTRQTADPEFCVVYEEEAAKKELWLQLVEARPVSGDDANVGVLRHFRSDGGGGTVL